MDASIITNYFPKLSDTQRQQFESLGALYDEWNQKINVISRKDIETLYERHVLHSLSIARFIKFNDGADMLDIGTGGGFPGIPLAILYPKVNFTLVDSIGKKIKVVEAVAHSCGLDNVTAIHQRAEKIKGKFDFIVTRAVARSKMIWSWSHDKFKTTSSHNIENGIIALKGGDLSEEMEELKRPYQQTLLSTYFSEDFFDTKSIIYIPR
ncbi:MAG: 16S rRNA (guanine(527)-N(7))-methyltransferase RsmG [Cyclobacteriaceae bacterium]